MKARDIRTNYVDVTCDVCGRTLLRGERYDSFLAAGSRRSVCELCTARATHEGWIREDGLDELGGVRRTAAHSAGRGGLLGRLRARHRRAGGEATLEPLPPELPAQPSVWDAEPVRPTAPAPPPPDDEPRRPRHVRAVPTNAELKMQRAVEVFNRSHHVRTVSGVGRSLGTPGVAVRPLADRPSVVAITVGWELCWYRYEVDLSDEAGGARRAGQGAELAELEPADREPNAEADARGALHLTVAAE